MFAEIQTVERLVNIVRDIVPMTELIVGFEDALWMKFEVVRIDE